MELWTQIKGYPSYEVSTEGSVRRKLKNGSVKSLKACDNGNGYLRLNLYKNGTAKKCYLHRLVADAFLPNRKKLPEVHHQDHDKRNNTLPNLKWVTSEENNRHKVVYYRNKEGYK